MGKHLFFFFGILVSLASCGNQASDAMPKPRGFFRLYFPEKTYQPIEQGCPFSFEMPTYAVWAPDLSEKAKPCWKNLDFPNFNARLHISYFNITPEASFAELTEDARTFAFKHTAKATAIDQVVIHHTETDVHGILYEIRGNSASNVQFFVSDSTKHYLRGALYFNEKPHLDSIKPILDFIRADIDHLINTFSWK
ncbi:gliding motility lipoprotein GldD [Sphingobacterium wenxiniae]|uniref:Gliding motility-associated lipoprotein GldD n=1 Tax=Sphingobacterium wenxiniae TaxID=683125 RepID=A0A1I6UI04_9SPHI|nr:gliding motility lipoprotein GldD [Sphingobacterium wenxiniae]SFT01096.1 gliding motility-associated lipoprotein GldD [Sphingobacterium wenxiniae]